MTLPATLLERRPLRQGCSPSLVLVLPVGVGGSQPSKAGDRRDLANRECRALYTDLVGDCALLALPNRHLDGRRRRRADGRENLAATISGKKGAADITRSGAFLSSFQGKNVGNNVIDFVRAQMNDRHRVSWYLYVYF